ncbi:MAG: menaquinone-dependent protoporphyrinogen IX dehydrogenase [Gammaproteobacteria bacterium]|nr:menaquinone-dependent protoporphyrinogen IX dehydrogenase [Gammaproteobacteria bacterium]
MPKTLIIYSTTDGQTRKICLRLQQILEQQNNLVTLISVTESDSVNLSIFDKIIIGASIRYGKHNKNIYEFINTNRAMLESKVNAFFSVNVVARKPNKDTPETNPYLKRFLSQVSWHPKKLAVFAGKIEYQKYTFWDRTIIRLIMWITKGPTDPKANIEFTDWEKVNKFGEALSKM